MSDPAKTHEAKRFCMNRQSSLVPVSAYNANSSQTDENRSTESVNHSSLAIPRHIRIGTNFSGPSWSPIHGFQMRLGLDVANELGGLTFDSFRHYTEHPFEQLVPLNLSKKSTGSTSNYFSSTDGSLPENVDNIERATINSGSSNNETLTYNRNLSNNDNLWRTWTDEPLPINGDNIDLLSKNGSACTRSMSNKESTRTNSKSTINENVCVRSPVFIKPTTIDYQIGNSSTNGKTSINENSLQGQRCAWTNDQTSPNSHSSPTLPLKKRLAILYPSVANTSKAAEEADAGLVNTVSALISGNTLTKGNQHLHQSMCNDNGSPAKQRVANFDPTVANTSKALIKTASSPIAASENPPNANGSSAKQRVANFDPIVANTATKKAEAALIKTASSPIPASKNPSMQTLHPVLKVLNIYLGMDGTTASQGRPFDPTEPTVNGILFRVQEAQRLAQLVSDDPTEEDMRPIVDVLERPGVKPDMDETCLISFNQNLARDQSNGPRRSIKGHMERILNNDSARTCRIQNTATATQVSNDVFLQMKRQKRLTKRWSEELTTLKYLQELMTHMGLNCETYSEDGDENDEDIDIEEDLGCFTGNMLETYITMKEEVDSDDEERDLVIDYAEMNDA